jgi:hypothetical protein
LCFFCHLYHTNVAGDTADYVKELITIISELGNIHTSSSAVHETHGVIVEVCVEPVHGAQCYSLLFAGLLNLVLKLLSRRHSVIWNKQTCEEPDNWNDERKGQVEACECVMW